MPRKIRRRGPPRGPVTDTFRVAFRGVRHRDSARDVRAGEPMAKHASRTVVYTAVLGGDQPLREQPVAGDSTADFLCFTDDADLRSQTWEPVLVQPRLAGDVVRSARYLKIV